jgi:hypothetical protein
MRLLGPLIVGLVLGGPTAARAQVLVTAGKAAPTAKPADLVGQWARQGEKEVRLTFRADSTMTAKIGPDVGQGTATGRWRLVGDTLLIRDYVVTIGGRQVSTEFGRRLVALKDNQLTMTRVDTKESKSRVYERVSPAKP